VGALLEEFIAHTADAPEIVVVLAEGLVRLGLQLGGFRRERLVELRIFVNFGLIAHPVVVEGGELGRTRVVVADRIVEA
ncbi:MAG TPA: hypothetical protein VFG99_12870, partial [Chloroflexia bacterium]|nr:hypothetical protein [Chloroflexia bacterium]